MPVEKPIKKQAVQKPPIAKPAVRPVKKSASPTPAVRDLKKYKPSLWTRLNVRLSFRQKLFFAKYLSILLDAGLPLDSALRTLSEQSKGPLKKIVDTLIQQVQSGLGIADGLARFPHIFSNIFISLIRAGEESGTLEDNLKYLTDQMQKQYDLTRSVRGAMIYPIIILIGGTAVSVLVVIFVLPNIVTLFQTLDVKLPITTRILIWVSKTLTTYPIQIILTILGTLLLGFGFGKTPFGKRTIDKIVLYIPAIRTIVKSAILARTFRLIGVSVKSGTPIEDALEVAIATLRHTQYRLLFIKVKTIISQGGEFSAALKSSPGLIPPIAQHLIHVGSETGTLVDSLLYLAEFYEKEVEETSRSISTLIEPFLIIVMGVMVAFLAFSIISPIYQIVGNV